MDENRKVYHDIFSSMNYPSYIDEDFTYKIFGNVLYSLAERIEKDFLNKIPDSKMVFAYIIVECEYLFSSSNEEKRNELIKDERFIESFSNKLVDKIFFNEYAPYKSIALINQYNPLISSLRFYLNFILNRFTVINTTNKLNLN